MQFSCAISHIDGGFLFIGMVFSYILLLTSVILRATFHIIFDIYVIIAMVFDFD